MRIGAKSGSRRAVALDILLASTRPDLCDGLRLYLTETRGCNVTVVADPGALVSRTATRRPDVVLLDTGMAPSILPWLVAQVKGCPQAPRVVLLLTPSHAEPQLPPMGEDARAAVGDPPEALARILAAFEVSADSAHPGPDGRLPA